MKLIETKAEFDSLLSSEEKLIVIDFYADWCGPCRMIAPKLEKLAEKYPNAVFVKVNVDDNAETAENCKVSAMPTFQFFKGGKKVGEVVGANETAVEAEINKNI